MRTESETENTKPKRMLDGKCNPEYAKWHRAKRKAEGNPIKQKPWPAEKKRAYRKTEAGKLSMKKWRTSEKGIAARSKYLASEKGILSRRETSDEYASRIIKELEFHQNRPSYEEAGTW